jgi:hypothetical protein
MQNVGELASAKFNFCDFSRLFFFSKEVVLVVARSAKGAILKELISDRNPG